MTACAGWFARAGARKFSTDSVRALSNSGGGQGVSAPRPVFKSTYVTKDGRVQAIVDCGGDWRKASSLLREYQDKGEASVAAHNALMAVFNRGRQAFKALEVLTMMVATGPEPNDASYKLAANACSRAKTKRCYDAAINACGRGGQWARAVELLQLMRRQNVKPGDETYMAAIFACEKCGQWDKAMELLRELAEMHVIRARDRDIFSKKPKNNKSRGKPVNLASKLASEAKLRRMLLERLKDGRSKALGQIAAEEAVPPQIAK